MRQAILEEFFLGSHRHGHSRTRWVSGTPRAEHGRIQNYLLYILLNNLAFYRESQRFYLRAKGRDRCHETAHKIGALGSRGVHDLSDLASTETARGWSNLSRLAACVGDGGVNTAAVSDRNTRTKRWLRILSRMTRRVGGEIDRFVMLRRIGRANSSRFVHRTACQNN